jgi:hypothetical protein
MPRDASDLAHRLAREAEAVCRHYLFNGRREGRYWLIGDVRNTPGRSMFVRLKRPESGRGAAGKWTDAATAEHGDLLDTRKLRPSRISRRRRRGTPLSQHAPHRHGPRAESHSIAHSDGIARSGTTALRRVAADRTDSRGSVFTQSRHYGFARSRGATLSPALLLQARRERTDRDLAGNDRPR